jgi:hypothetical protein
MTTSQPKFFNRRRFLPPSGCASLTPPFTNWQALTTNTFDGSGQFHYTNPVSPAKPRQFFIFKLP